MATSTTKITNHEITDINREFEERDAIATAQKHGLPYVHISTYPLNPDVIKFVPQEESKKGEILAFDRVKRTLKIAVTNPENKTARELLEKIKQNGRKYNLYICSKTGFNEAFKAYDAEYLNRKKLKLREKVQENDVQQTNFQTHDFEKKETEISAMPSKQAFHEIKLLALKYKASDIHMQPDDEGMVVRYRVDGILHDIFHFNIAFSQGIITRAKYECGMRANLKDIPQDGHARIRMNGRDIDLRVSSIPTPTRESIVIRILDPERGIKSFEKLGFSQKNEQKIKEVLKKKTGMTLVTGPTGSGKTTSLYSMLSVLNSPDRKIVTLEDPVEYHLEGVTQSEVNEQKEYNFETGLKALVRHDPDVILVGEIRSYQTAKLAIEASLTGHIVLSSLHTNNALGAIDRLKNLGVEAYNIAPALNAVFAQRLVRKVCPHCIKKVELPQNDKKFQEAFLRIQKVYPQSELPTEMIEPQGCDECANIGYTGQIAITEAFVLDETVKQMILDQKSTIDIAVYVHENTNNLSLFEDGILKILEGKTTLSEIYRVIG